MGTVVKQLRQVPEQPSFASILDIYRDILALHAEFDDVSWDLRAKTLSVTTTDIVLEGVYLGAFEIRLVFGSLTRSNAYEVIAVDPHPAASDESVTHPHVQDNEPCEGEAGLPIEQALKDGRIAYFYLIVLNLLNTYNSGSPHVALKNWEGVACRDCGANVSEDERFSCEHCGDVLCDGCFVSCPSCDALHCSQCLETCSGCDESACRYCLKPCSECGDRFCPTCLSEKGMCDTCHEEEQEKETARQDSTAATANATVPGVADQPDRVGQVALPA